MKRSLPALLGGMLLLSACFGSPDQSGSVTPIPAANASPSAVKIEAADYKFAASAASSRAGVTDFVVTNAGATPHEFVIVPFREGRYSLPLGEIEALAPGETRAIRANLPSGSYQFVCLLVKAIEGQPQVVSGPGAVPDVTSHMALGMFIPFEVN